MFGPVAFDAKGDAEGVVYENERLAFGALRETPLTRRLLVEEQRRLGKQGRFATQSETDAKF